MNRLIFKKSENNNITVIIISNYQELTHNYNFDELNKRILNYIIENKIIFIKLRFSNILNNGLSISEIYKIPELLFLLDIKVYGIEILFAVDLLGDY